MKVNIFEGARRIALAMGVLWSLGCIGFAGFSEPNAHLTYSIAWPGTAPVQAAECGDSDGREFTYATTRGGNRVSVTLCLTAHQVKDGELLVPYAPAPDSQWWMAGRYSSEVSKYGKEVERTFQLPASGSEEGDRLHHQARVEQWKQAMQVMFGGLLIGWALVAVIGWIVRGFLGIPRGKDARTAGN